VFASSSLTLEQDLSESESDEGAGYETSTSNAAQVASDAFKTLSMVSSSVLWGLQHMGWAPGDEQAQMSG
jgi:hypothetical protein